MTHLPKFNAQVSEDGNTYYFDSPGPQGVVKKAIRFQLQDEEGEMYNLMFGDQRPDGTINDSTITGFGAIRQILATVADAVYDFTKGYPGRQIFFIGRTVKHTRAYHRAISQHYEELRKDFRIFGLEAHLDSEGEILSIDWHDFDSSETYDAYVGIRRGRGLKVHINKQ